MHWYTPLDSFFPTTSIVEVWVLQNPHMPHKPLAIIHPNTILPHQIREMKILCFILKMRMSNCSLQLLLGNCLGNRSNLFRCFRVNYLLKSSATIYPYPMLQLVGLTQLTQILQMFVKAIFDEQTERIDWPLSQRNLNVNEDEFGTQVEQQLQDGTVFALRVSCCKFWPRIFSELQTCQCSTAAANHCLEDGVTSAYDQIYYNYSF